MVDTFFSAPGYPFLKKDPVVLRPHLAMPAPHHCHGAGPRRHTGRRDGLPLSLNVPSHIPLYYKYILYQTNNQLNLECCLNGHFSDEKSENPGLSAFLTHRHRSSTHLPHPRRGRCQKYHSRWQPLLPAHHPAWDV